MEATLVSPDSPLWLRALERLDHDFHHLPGYAALDARWLSGEPAAVVAVHDGATLLAPFVIRSCADVHPDLAQYQDAVSPYGYGGVLVGPEPVAPETKAALLAAMESVLRENAVIAAFMRLHPILDACAEALVASGVTVVSHDPTLAVDLSGSQEDWLQSLGSGHRQGVHKLLRAGFTTRVDEWDDYPALIQMYAETMQRIGAGEHYHFDGAYFDALRKALGNRAHLCTVLSPEGDPANVGLFIRVGDIIEGHLAGSDDTHRRHAPAKLMYAEVVRWGREHGCRHVHLGGGGGSLREFKAGFANASFALRSAWITLDPIAYDDACRLVCGDGWRQCTLRFFPEYRRCAGVGDRQAHSGTPPRAT
jgi:hypothetical protein